MYVQNNLIKFEIDPKGTQQGDEISFKRVIMLETPYKFYFDFQKDLF